MKKILSALIFSLVATGISPAYAATVSRLESAPGQSQSDWEATDAYKAFVCPAGTLRGGGVDMNFTTDRGDDKYFVTCDEPSPTAADDADFSQRSREAAAAAEAESQAYSAANPGKQKCIQWGPIVHRNGISTASGGVCANVVPVSSTTESLTASSTSTPTPETSTAPTPAPSATPSASPTPTSTPAPSVSANSRIPFTQPCTGGSDRTPGLPQCLMPEGLGGSAWNLVDNNTGVVLNGAVCSEAVCGRNGEWRQWPADRILNGQLWPNGYPEGATYIQTPFDAAYWGRYFTNGVYEVNGGGILQPGSSTIVWPVRVEIPRVDTPTVTTESTTSTSIPSQTPASPGTPAPTSGPVTVTPSTPAPSSETQTTVTRVDTTTSQPVAPTSSSSSDDDGTLDEVEAEEEIIDSIEAVVQSNGTTRIQVSTGYLSTALTVVATKKGSKKKYTYKITTNAEGDRKFKSGLNLRGYTVILYKGSTELDRMYIS